MYRTAARRLLTGVTASNYSKSHLRLLKLETAVRGSRFCTSVNPAPSTSVHQNPNQSHIPPIVVEVPVQSNTNTSSSSKGQRHQKKRVNAAVYEEEQARVLQASLRHVVLTLLRLGWSEEAMIAGAREVGVSPSIVGSFARKEAALVEFFMDECLQKLIDRIDLGEDLQNLVPSDRISKLIKIRLEMQAPYISKWPQALSIQAHPSNLPTSFKQRAMLVDEIWHAAGDDSFDMDWYVKRTVLGGIYSTTEIYMLTDSSPDFRDTWAFLDDRVKDAFDLKKTVQEARYLAEAVGAGMGSSLQGFMKKVMQG